MHKEQDIIDWAKERGIFMKGDPLTQGLKTFEEVAEVINDHLKGRDISIELGDVYVTLVLQARMQGTDLEDCLTAVPVRATFKEQVADLGLDVAMMLESIQSGNTDVTIYIGNALSGLYILARMQDLDLHTCINLAYAKISERSGKMVDGVFRNESGC